MLKKIFHLLESLVDKAMWSVQDPVYAAKKKLDQAKVQLRSLKDTLLDIWALKYEHLNNIQDVEAQIKKIDKEATLVTEDTSLRILLVRRKSYEAQLEMLSQTVSQETNVIERLEQEAINLDNTIQYNEIMYDTWKARLEASKALNKVLGSLYLGNDGQGDFITAMKEMKKIATLSLGKSEALLQYSKNGILASNSTSNPVLIGEADIQQYKTQLTTGV